jgi:hypothetical protein
MIREREGKSGREASAFPLPITHRDHCHFDGAKRLKNLSYYKVLHKKRNEKIKLDLTPHPIELKELLGLVELVDHITIKNLTDLGIW